VLADQPVEVHLAVYAEIMSGVKNKMLLEQYSFSRTMMFVLQETKPFALVVRLGFALNSGRKSVGDAAPPAATTSATNVVDAGAMADMAEQKKALRAEVGAHNKTKTELAQKTARIARLEEELRHIRAQAAPPTPPKRERSPDRRRSGAYDHNSRTRRN